MPVDGDEHTESRWAKWARNGRLSAIVFGVSLLADTTLRLLQVPAPEIDNLVVVFGGVLAGNLMVAKGGDKK